MDFLRVFEVIKSKWVSNMIQRRHITIDLITIHDDDFPGDVRGMCQKTGDDSFCIAINGRLSEEEQEASFLHECRHIWNNDHEKMNLSADSVETAAQT